jgi:hypothetical protein
MSLLEALLLDSYRMNIWVAYRTDGVAGSGTQSDPFDGSTQAKFDANMNALPVPVLSITFSSTTATVTAISHGFANTNSVLIAGATGSDAQYYKGTFTISSVTPNSFQYALSHQPSANAQGAISCRCEFRPYRPQKNPFGSPFPGPSLRSSPGFHITGFQP